MFSCLSKLNDMLSFLFLDICLIFFQIMVRLHIQDGLDYLNIHVLMRNAAGIVSSDLFIDGRFCDIILM